MFFRLPKNVLFVDVPIPARYCPKNKGFLTEGINLEDYNDEERWITFETDLFGIFGLFQKRYFNFPYKLWKLQGGKTVELSLTGKCLSLRIEISQEGCRVKSIKPGKFDVSELLKSDDWMTPEELLQKLCLVGINMIYKRKDHKLVGLSPKNYQLEELTYNSMALLSEEYDFSWSKWNCKLPPGGIALNYERADQRKEERLNLALIRRERVIQLKHGEEMMEFNNEPVDEQKFSGTLFDLVLQEPPKEPHKFIAQSGCKENVRLLLRKTAILSCS
ncbi:protein CASC1 [Caerostris darwini]|uniref:Protein CASC1 n=1 Tax=Caerostris darwini TaxID=1538125 RepID=A0AAV4N1R6_9ARAC|nr:protein CASC1 [Caerostris darwini]